MRIVFVHGACVKDGSWWWHRTGLDIDPEGGTFTVRPDALAETFLQDCDPEIQREGMGISMG
jgi:hypothetical protein